MPLEGFSNGNYANTMSDTHKIISIYVTYEEGIF